LIVWKDSSPNDHYVLSGTLNPTHSLTLERELPRNEKEQPRSCYFIVLNLLSHPNLHLLLSLPLYFPRLLAWKPLRIELSAQKNLVF